LCAPAEQLTLAFGKFSDTTGAVYAAWIEAMNRAPNSAGDRRR